MAYGRDIDGARLALAAAAYPAKMCKYLAGAFDEGVADTSPAQGHRYESPTTGEGKEVKGVRIEGGRISHGPQLATSLRAEVNRCRKAAPAFASVRNRVDTTADERMAEALPHGFLIPAQRTNPRTKRGRPRASLRRVMGARERLLTPSEHTPIQPGTEAEGRPTAARELTAATAAKPEGDIRIEQLYLEGVYQQVREWLARADAAAAAIAQRRKGVHVAIPRVPTVVIEQHQMPSWAQGKVWDCTDRNRCVPVTRSTRHTVFPSRPDGQPARQIDRAALRAAAAELDWHDTDIIDQAGEGGMEPRSACDLITVLAFHHPGLLEEVAAAEQIVQKHTAEGWVSPGTRDLPYVPCRLQPRDVVMQERARAVKRAAPRDAAAEGGPGGSQSSAIEIEHYT